MRAALRRLLSRNLGSGGGSLWIDRKDAAGELGRRVRAGMLADGLGEKIAHFMANGYAVLPGAVPPALADRVADTITNAYRNGDPRLLYHTDGRENLVPAPGTDPRGKRVVESHAVLPEVRDVLSVPDVIAFLHAIFEEQPVLTQSLHFQTGSEQGFHRDPVHVVYDDPLRMAAAWIALEDIVQGSGELRYIVQSHRLPDHRFSTGRRDCHGAGPGELDAFLAWLVAESDRRHLERSTFLAKKGDVLIWHAGLAHGGSPVTRPEATRKSLVGHYCPRSARPTYGRAGVRREHGPMLYSSYLYEL